MNLDVIDPADEEKLFSEVLKSLSVMDFDQQAVVAIMSYARRKSAQ
jgi:hypothetical protein